MKSGDFELRRQATWFAARRLTLRDLVDDARRPRAGRSPSWRRWSFAHAACERRRQGDLLWKGATIRPGVLMMECPRLDRHPLTAPSPRRSSRRHPPTTHSPARDPDGQNIRTTYTARAGCADRRCAQACAPHDYDAFGQASRRRRHGRRHPSSDNTANARDGTQSGTRRRHHRAQTALQTLTYRRRHRRSTILPQRNLLSRANPSHDRKPLRPLGAPSRPLTAGCVGATIRRRDRPSAARRYNGLRSRRHTYDARQVFEVNGPAGAVTRYECDLKCSSCRRSSTFGG